MAHFHEKRRTEEWRKYQQAQKLKDEYDNLLPEVEAVRALNKAPKQWLVGELKSMVKWYKRDELDKAMPVKRLTYLQDIMRPAIKEREQPRHCRKPRCCHLLLL